MERSQALLLPLKPSNFSFSSHEEKLCESNRNLPPGPANLKDKYEEKDRAAKDTKQGGRGEGGEGEGEEKEKGVRESEEGASKAEEANSDLGTLFEYVDRFLDAIRSIGNGKGQPSDPPEVPDSVEKFVSLVEKEIITAEAREVKCGRAHDAPQLLLDAIDRVSKLTAAFSDMSSDAEYSEAMKRVRSILDHAMSFLEEELYSLLDDPQSKQDSGGSSGSQTKWPQSDEPDRCVIAQLEPSTIETAPAYPQETIKRLRRIANTMVSAGYETECCQAFSVTRRNAFDARLLSLGLAKTSIDDIKKIGWESLEGQIVTWTKLVRHARSVYFARERELYSAVFTARPDLGHGLFCNLARAAIVHLLNFAEAIAMTKRSAERLFKVLDMYEALRDVSPRLDRLFRTDEPEDGDGAVSPIVDLKPEIFSTLSRLGEAAVTIFCELESSIKTDTAKSAVPGGAVHPLTRYVMNYLKYACEYKKTLEQVFREHRKSENSMMDTSDNVDQSAFAMQLVAIMDLLQSNLETKSKLYKDPALSNVFLMNNGRYIVQKIKSSAEISEVLGEAWGRKKSSELRQYHKNYQRETWGRVLACLREEGLQANGRVVKPVLKERLKSFNAMFEEIHRAQSAWVVSDEQLQSELRVSVSAVVVPAYRSFIGRFRQHLDAGRQTKYIKFGSEELENYIDELFDGNPRRP